MIAMTLAEAKQALDALAVHAAAGDDVRILRNGETVARLVVAERKPRQPIDIEAILALHAEMPFQTESSADLVRRMRDDARY